MSQPDLPEDNPHDGPPVTGICLVGSFARTPEEKDTVPDSILAVVRRTLGWCEGNVRQLPGGELYGDPSLPWAAEPSQLIFQSLFKRVERDNPGLQPPLMLRPVWKRLTSIAYTGGDKYWHYAVRQLVVEVWRPQFLAALHKYGLPSLDYYAWRANHERESLGKLLDPPQGEPRQFKVGLPTGRALQFFSGFRLDGQLVQFDDALFRQAQQIVEQDPGTVIQAELPVETLLATLVAACFWRRRAWKVAQAERLVYPVRRLFSELSARTDEDIQGAVHICYGDLRGIKLIPWVLQLIGGRIVLVNAVTTMAKRTACCHRFRLVAIHDPGGHTGWLASRKLRRRLHRLPDGTAYAIGLIDTKVSAERLAKQVRHHRRALDGVATSIELAAQCGDGRKQLGDAHRAYSTACAVLRNQR